MWYGRLAHALHGQTQACNELLSGPGLLPLAGMALRRPPRRATGIFRVRLL